MTSPSGEPQAAEVLGRLAQIDLYAVFIETTDAYPGMTPEYMETMTSHVAFLAGLEQEGRLLLASAIDFDPTRTGAGSRAMIVLRADDADEVARVMNDDPLRTTGCVTHSIHSFQVNFGRLAGPLAELLGRA